MQAGKIEPSHTNIQASIPHISSHLLLLVIVKGLTGRFKCCSK